MADTKLVYLISGDDDAKIDAWRSRLRTRAEQDGGPGALELFDARAADPDEVAASLSAMSLVPGTRYVLADGAEAWKSAPALEPLGRVMSDMPPETVLVLIARGKASPGLTKAVTKAGGDVRAYAAPRAGQLPGWVVERAREHGLHLDSEAARALVEVVGGRQQRLVREIEKLALAVHPRTQVSAEEIERLATGESALETWELADALVAGDRGAALRLAERLRDQDERPGRLIYPIVRRLREVHRAAELLDRGTPERDVAAAIRLPPWVARRVVAQARGADREGLERALCALADLELELRSPTELDDDAALSLAITSAAAA